jgi:hypothetical protein
MCYSVLLLWLASCGHEGLQQLQLLLCCCEQVAHIQQIKALCPEALGWEHILAINPASKKQEQQLLLKLPAAAGNTKQNADTAQMQQQFFKRLQQHMLKHKVCL